MRGFAGMKLIAAYREVGTVAREVCRRRLANLIRDVKTA